MPPELIANASLPSFLWLTHMSDNLDLDGTVKHLATFGELAASFGSISEVGGVVGTTTDVETLKLLSLTVDPISLSPYTEEFTSLPVTEYWREISTYAVEVSEFCIEVYETESIGLLPMYVYSFHQSQNLDYPNDVIAIKQQHDVEAEIWDRLRENPKASMAVVNGAFTSGIAPVRNRPHTFTWEHGAYVDEAPDPITKTYKNPQSETGLEVGSMYSRQQQLHLCREWAYRYQPDAERFFVEPTYR